MVLDNLTFIDSTIISRIENTSLHDKISERDNCEISGKKGIINRSDCKA